MQGDCEAAAQCLFCAFAHVAHLHSRCPALLEAQTTHFLKEARRHSAEEEVEVQGGGGGGEEEEAEKEIKQTERIKEEEEEAEKEIKQTERIKEEEEEKEEEGDHEALQSILQAKEFCVYKKQAGNPSSNPSSSLHDCPSIFYRSQVHEHPLTVSNRLKKIYHGDKAFTYSQVLAYANTLASQLQKVLLHSCENASCDILDDSVLLNSVKKVGISIGPSVEYVVAVLAVLQCGFAFVPLEPSWPARRITEVVADSNPCILLTSQHPSDFSIAPIASSLALPILCVNLSSPSIFDHGSNTNCLCFCHTNQVRRYCYLLYTSGSSGKPKGVYGTEIGLLHRLQWMQMEYPFLKGDVAVFKSSIAFVDHLTELFGPLLGGSLVIVPPAGDLYRNPLGLLPFMQAYNVSRLTAVPSLMRSLLPVLSTYPSNHALMSVKVLVLSGEILSYDLLKSLQVLLPHTTILNLYGSTELSGDCLCFDCGSLEKVWGEFSVPIGKPLPGSLIEVFSENSEIGDEGELWVGGVLVALGYHHDPSSTNSKFMRAPGPEAKYPKSRFFRTGDCVKKLKDENLLFLGRKDRIVKVNGHKVVLDEIESNLEKHPLVAQAAVSFQKAASTDSIIVAYVVLEQQRSSNVNEVLETPQGLANVSSDENSEKSLFLKSWLAERLPSAMIPSRFTFLNVLPMVSAGKKDYHALALLDVNRLGMPFVDPSEADVSSLTVHIRKAFQHVLKMDGISIHDDFFSLGGTSVSAAHVAHILAIDIRLLYSHSSVIKLEPILKALQDEAMGSSALRLDEGSSDSRAFKRMKRDESFNASKLAAASCHNGQSSFNLGLNIRQANNWPCVNITDPPMALLRCNVRVPIDPCPRMPTTRMVHNLSLDSVSTNGLCNLSILWKAELKACVDASPVLVQSTNSWHLFIGSHAHNFACLDAYSGNVVWERDLGNRLESTAALTSDFKQVVVGCYDGNVYFLERETGIVNWKFETKAEVKCQPTVGIREGLIWCGSHDHHLYVLNAVDQKCVWEHDCKASIFAAAAHDLTRCLTYVATTAGTIIAFSTDGSHPRVTWTHVCEAPVFGSLALDAASGNIICTLVNGCVLALTSSGLIAWKHTTGGPIFAGATLTSALPLQVLICCRDGWVYSLHLFEGRCLWKYCVGEPITSAAYVDEGINLVFRESHDDGTVYLHSFRLLCACGSSGEVHILKVFAGSTTSTNSSCSFPVKEWHKGRQPFNERRNIGATIGNRKNDILVERENANKTEGAFVSEDAMFTVDNGCELLAALKLSGDVFSSPVMLGGRIFVGCRDNHLYCLEISGLDL